MRPKVIKLELSTLAHYPFLSHLWICNFKTTICRLFTSSRLSQVLTVFLGSSKFFVVGVGSSWFFIYFVDIRIPVRLCHRNHNFVNYMFICMYIFLVCVRELLNLSTRYFSKYQMKYSKYFVCYIIWIYKEIWLVYVKKLINYNWILLNLNVCCIVQYIILSVWSSTQRLWLLSKTRERFFLLIMIQVVEW